MELLGVLTGAVIWGCVGGGIAVFLTVCVAMKVGLRQASLQGVRSA